jgi:hypothetical protein
MREVNEARLALADINNSPYCGSRKRCLNLSFVIGKACALPSAQLIRYREIQLPPGPGRGDARIGEGSL